jgi:hypothetical protein
MVSWSSVIPRASTMPLGRKVKIWDIDSGEETTNL